MWTEIDENDGGKKGKTAEREHSTEFGNKATPIITSVSACVFVHDIGISL